VIRGRSRAWERGVPIGKDDRNAGFTAFVNASMPEPAHIALFLTGDVHQTNELVQAGLVKTSLQVRPGEAIAHTWRNMLNHRTDQWPRAGARSWSRNTAPPPSCPTEATTIDDVDGLMGSPRTWPDRQRRRVVVLRHYCDLSERQVGDGLGSSAGRTSCTIRRSLDRCHSATLGVRPGPLRPESSESYPTRRVERVARGHTSPLFRTQLPQGGREGTRTPDLSRVKRTL
jgi:DNA-directed RNA polymerase specialized sigma24 family protein